MGLHDRVGEAGRWAATVPLCYTHTIKHSYHKEVQSMPAYREQFDRTMRWYHRFAAINQGRPHQMTSDHYIDDIYSFFQNCYHLKDWIKHDSKVATSVQQEVETYINSNRPLRLCADICNSLKHLRLTSNRSGEGPAFGQKQYALTLQPGMPPEISLRYAVDTTPGAMDAFELATECVQAWEAFLSAKGL